MDAGPARKYHISVSLALHIRFRGLRNADRIVAGKSKFMLYFQAILLIIVGFVS